MFDVFYIGKPPNLFAFERSVDNIQEAADLSRTRFFWLLHGDNDYSNFNFEWRCMPYDDKYVHVFPSQWQRNGLTYFASKQFAKHLEYKFHAFPIVPRKENKDNWIIPDNIDTTLFDFSWHPDHSEIDYEHHFGTNWQTTGGPVYKGSAGFKSVNDQKATTTSTEIFYIDFMNDGSNHQLEKLKTKWPNIKSIRYVDSHLNVLKRAVNLATSKTIWVISSICDYSDFDFTWHPDLFQNHMIHVFYGKNAVDYRGDTFYINIESFNKQMYDLELLDWFKVINYCRDQSVERFSTPVCYYNDNDNLIDIVKQYNFNFPYTIFTNQKDSLPKIDLPCLWSQKDRVIERLSRSGAITLVPKDIKMYLRFQFYDYPYIRKNLIGYDYFGDKGLSQLDIVYISNGEPNEQQYYKWLENSVNNNVIWVRGINSRTAAIKHAATRVKTPWFYCVPAKLKVNQNFDWTWMPDFFQQPKHYIFHAHNPVNTLEYGHMGMIAYNKNLVLATDKPGLDFTMSKPHEVVPILSGTAYFNQDPKTTWRTAFREVVKLKHYQSVNPTVENSYRLKLWSTKAEGDYAAWSILGAEDAHSYYDTVDGNLADLELSYTWQWLDEYIKNKGYNI